MLEASRRGSTTLPHVARCRTPGARRRFRVQPRADRARRQVPGDTQTMLTRARGTDSTTLLVTDRVEPSRSDGTLRIEPTPIGGASTPAPPTQRRLADTQHAAGLGRTHALTSQRLGLLQLHDNLLRRVLRELPHGHPFCPATSSQDYSEQPSQNKRSEKPRPLHPPELCGVACPASLHGLPLAAAYPRPRQWLSPYASEPALLPRRHFHHPSEHVPQVPRRGFRRLRRLKSPADTSQPDLTWPNSVYGQFSRIMEDSPPPINNRESTIVHKLVDTIHRKN